MNSIHKFAVVYLFLLKYIANGVSAKKCDFGLKLEQTLLNEGFHRKLTYEIAFDTESSTKRSRYVNCTLGIDQTLPLGVFANPDELQDLKRQNILNAVLLNPVNVELPAEHSTPNSAYIFSDLVSDVIVLSLPLHARYHQAAPGGGLARNEIEQPKIYIRCPDKRLEACGAATSQAKFVCSATTRERCLWRQIPFTPLTDIIVWDIPVGNTDHYYIISIGTLTVVVVSSLYMLKTILEWQIHTLPRLVLNKEANVDTYSENSDMVDSGDSD